jgi:hypothetical protein
LFVISLSVLLGSILKSDVNVVNSRRIRSGMGKVGVAYRTLVVKLEWKRPLESLCHGWEDNTEIHIMDCYVRLWTTFIWLWRTSFRFLWAW